jgi:hypothetical protein
VAYDEKLAERVRRILAGRCDFAEKQMFGGLAFMVAGHMCCGVVGDDLMVRVGPDKFEEALARPHARVMDFTGRPSRGMVYVGARGTETSSAVAAWVDRGLVFVQSLPRRAPAKRKR